MKGFSTLATIAAAFAGSVAALPINDNGTAAYEAGDINVINFALTLEYLELNLYETVVTAYNNQDFEDAGFTANDRSTFLQIISQEMDHISFLRNGVYMLGGTPVEPCKYNYGNFTNLKQLLNITDVVNGLGPSAYLGSGAFITSKVILTESASIGNIESRHNSWLSGLLGRSEQPYMHTTPYQLPLSPTQSYGVAAQFIVDGSCSSTLPIVTAYPPTLMITNSGYPAAPLVNGAKVYFEVPSKQVSAKKAAFLYSFNTTIVNLNSDGSATIPSDFSGQGYIVLTTASQGETLNDANSLTAPQALFVDVPAQNFAGDKVTTYDF